jgi:hypothetical protein
MTFAYLVRASGSATAAVMTPHGQLGSEIDDWLRAETEIVWAREAAIDEASEESFPASQQLALEAALVGEKTGLFYRGERLAENI